MFFAYLILALLCDTEINFHYGAVINDQNSDLRLLMVHLHLRLI
jgi:hypothetical protein